MNQSTLNAYSHNRLTFPLATLNEWSALFGQENVKDLEEAFQDRYFLHTPMGLAAITPKTEEGKKEIYNLAQFLPNGCPWKITNRLDDKKIVIDEGKA